MKFLAWLLSLFFAFNLGAQSASNPKATDEELRDRVQEHLDVIVDESAAIVDEVAENLRNDERVQKAEEFVQDVQEVAEETLEELNQVAENTRNRVEEKFGTGAQEDVPETGEEAVPEAEAVPETEAAPETESTDGETEPGTDTATVNPEPVPENQMDVPAEEQLPETPGPGEPING